jgi:hypothetical protein
MSNESFSECETCHLKVSESHRFLGWITLDIHSMNISIKNETCPHLGAYSGKSFKDERLDFCSVRCLKAYFDMEINMLAPAPQ